MRTLPLLAAALAFAFVVVSTARAEVIQIPLSQQGDSQLARPSKGMSKADVEKKFGAPESSQGPVGEPPITRWVYPDFVVMFEYDHVVHSVLKHKPKAPIDESEATQNEPSTEQDQAAPVEQ
ncbi:phosphodiesterase [Permianibacter fluminis]|uniref:phosphodiesterase n=1 Tax=Permianibacter fluminis TaxID=2738515 RepID=UPI001B7D7AB8|nr:phosphodiesterase [Permianibacter fluminis]